MTRFSYYSWKIFVVIILFFQERKYCFHHVPHANGGYSVFMYTENCRVSLFIVNAFFSVNVLEILQMFKRNQSCFYLWLPFKIYLKASLIFTWHNFFLQRETLMADEVFVCPILDTNHKFTLHLWKTKWLHLSFEY